MGGPFWGVCDNEYFILPIGMIAITYCLLVHGGVGGAHLLRQLARLLRGTTLGRALPRIHTATAGGERVLG